MIARTNQYLTFRLDDEVYALDVGNAREIVDTPRLTQMPNSPGWIRGVMNLRGSVVPVIDLKQKFGMGVTATTRDSCVLLVEFMLEEELFLIGLVVDSVLEVFELAPGSIEAPPKFGARYSHGYLRGMGRRDDRVFMILEADKAFADTSPAFDTEPDLQQPDTELSQPTPIQEEGSHAVAQ